MFRPGHYGVALALYAPVGGWLLAAGYPSAAVAGGAGVLWLTMLPDWDTRLPLVDHRGPTHTLPFVALVAGVAWLIVGTVADATAPALGLAGAAAGPVSLRAFAAGVAALAVLAHLAADLLTPMGVAVLWPLSGRRYSLSVTTADSAVWNYALFALGVFATAAAAYLGAELLAGAPAR
ncbi:MULTISPECIES: metal-dependent hydrolase [Halorussus]|uniref:metal-dependent hydrolase n=1 Tax=Halorussus TaxID=1070314 RepID=UPI000E20E22E|nr:MULTISPECIES: metal-dependent hydrolase [Halorussus]NHN59587.1 metal-dependent hydrolase [Halorussus sp. JP-T4]